MSSRGFGSGVAVGAAVTTIVVLLRPPEEAPQPTVIRPAYTASTLAQASAAAPLADATTTTTPTEHAEIPAPNDSVTTAHRWVPPSWSITGEARKSGAGILLFAYGGRQLQHFLREAAGAAKTFRRDNPRLRIAVLTNNLTVDRRIFDIHIQPRPDLLFAGDTTNGGQNRGDKLPRQWLTRLYYLAHSPFEITWALDSNVMSCTPSAAQAFLDDALANKMWGFDIAHASSGPRVMYPHNWNIVYRWTRRTSALFRDWLLLQLRRGVAYDDQKTLHMAEMRALHAKGLRLGQLSAAWSLAFYNVEAFGKRADNARVTRPIRGRAHVVHCLECTTQMCELLNGNGTIDARQLQQGTRQMMTTRRQCPGGVGCGVNYQALWSEAACKRALRRPWCAYRDVEPWTRAHVLGIPAIYKPPTEPLEEYRRSKRCGEMCEP